MIVVRTQKDKLFNYAECEELFNRYKDKLEEDGATFREILKRTCFYSFYDIHTRELIGCIYYYKKGRKLYMSAFAERGHHKLNLECLKESFSWWKSNIYAYCKEKPAILCLLRCGFEKRSKNMYVLRRNKNGKEIKFKSK